jgi:hypothetical protein
MIESDYALNDGNNHLCEFTFLNGVKVHGVITTFFPFEPRKYYLVKASVMREFKPFMDSNNYEEMRKLCVPINLADIIEVLRLQ